MTPERVAALVVGWVRLYTRGVPPGVARRRIDEIAADLHEEIAHGRGSGVGDGRIALGLLSRTLRGVPADASWRAGLARVPTMEFAMTVGTLARRPRARVAFATALLLLLPALAMWFTDEMAWGPLDFALAGALIAGAGSVIEWLVRRPGGIAYRAAVMVALVAALMFVWSNLALGMVGEPGRPANAMYLLVPAVAIGGTVLARLRPGHMARALLATALSQACVTAIVLLAGAHQAAGTSPAELAMVNGFFVGLLVVAGLLFRRAAPDAPRSSA